MNKLSVIKAIRFSEKDIELQEKLKKYSVDVPRFIREAIREKAKREWKVIKEDHEKGFCPF